MKGTYFSTCLKAKCFSTRDQPDVFNLHRPHLEDERERELDLEPPRDLGTMADYITETKCRDIYIYIYISTFGVVSYLFVIYYLVIYQLLGWFCIYLYILSGFLTTKATTLWEYIWVYIGGEFATKI